MGEAGIIDKTKKEETPKEHNINLVIETPISKEREEELVKKNVPVVKAVPVKKNEEEVVNRLKFNDKDSVLDMGTNKSSEIEAPKTLGKLENKMEENGVTKNQDTMELEKPKLESAPEKVVEEAGIIDKTKKRRDTKRT